MTSLRPPTAPRLSTVLALALAWSSAGCDEDSPPPGDECVAAFDGVCDEPSACAYGTDSTDCVMACAAAEPSPLVLGACAFRNPPEPVEPSPPPVPSEGTDHRVGHRHGIIEVPSGVDATLTVARHYQLYVPSSYRPERAAGLLVVMPGHRVGIFPQPSNTQTLREAELNGFLVVYAEQEWRWSDLRWAWWTDWDWSSDRENPDLIYLRRLVERIAAEYTLDRTRVFASGHSRGGAMAFIAALELPEVFAGAAPQSGFSEFGWHERIASYEGRRTPLYVVHGVQDPDVCIDCRPGGTCALTGRACGTVASSDMLVELLRDSGWNDDTLVYERRENVTHRWQPQLNQALWDFLAARPLPAEDLGGTP